MTTGHSRHVFPSSFTACCRRLARHRHTLTPGQSGHIAATLGHAAVTSVLARMQHLLHGRRSAETAVVRPIFVIGHWRTGTPLMHELLCLDPSHGFPHSYCCMNPHHFLLTERGMRMTPAGDASCKRPMDDVSVSMDSPQEDEFALLALGAPSPYEAFLFPASMMRTRKYFDISSLPESEQELWRKTLMGFLRTVSATCEGRRLVLKSPTHTFRINILLEMFPDAQFLHVVRNPYDVFASTVKMLESMFALYGMSPVRRKVIEGYVIGNGRLMESCLERDLSLIPDGAYHRVSYEKLTSRPSEVVVEIYKALSLGDAGVVLPEVARYFQERGEYKPNVHRQGEAQKTLVGERWRGMFIKYGYQLPSSNVKGGGLGHPS